MVIGRGRRRGDTNQHCVLLLLKKIRGEKVRERVRKKKEKIKVWKKNTGIKKYGKKVREKSTGKCMGKNTGNTEEK